MQGIIHGDLSVMMPASPKESKYEEMTLEIDLTTIKGSPLDDNSVQSNNDDSQQSTVDQETSLDLEGGYSAAPSTEPNFESTFNSTGIHIVNQRKKHGKNIFTCEVCSKIFDKRSRLVSHMLTHSDEKDHICSVCSKGFKNKSQLQRHSNTHSDIPRFCCNICGRGFKHNDVAKHIRRFHSGPRKSARGGVANPNAEITSQFTSHQEIMESSHHQTQQFVDSQTPVQELTHLQSHQVSLLSEGSEELEQKFDLKEEQQLSQPHSLDLGACHLDSLSSSNDSVPIGPKIAVMVIQIYSPF